MASEYVVQPVAKALQVLECIAREGREMSLTQVCSRTALPKTTVFRYLQTLKVAGFISHDEKTDLYRVGLRLWALGQLTDVQSQLRDLAMPHMRALRNEFNETVNLAELHGSQVLYLEMVESRYSLRTEAKLGTQDMAHCTAVGKAILAHLPEATVREYLPFILATRTPRTLRTLGELFEDLAQVRHRGYAIDNEENEEGAFCIAAPIMGRDGRPIAAISISAPTTRMGARLENAASGALKKAAREISTTFRP
jgi:IclR family acetate operon transcriptional repressor